MAAETSRERIRDVAKRLFALHGYDGTSLQAIADEVGLHKSSLFHHYASKVELAADVCEAAMVHVVDVLRPLADEDPPTLAGLLACVDELTDYFCDQPTSARLLVASMVAPAHSDLRLPIQPDSEHPVVTFFGLVWSWLERARRARVIRAVNIRQAIFNLIAVVVFYPAVAEETRDVAGAEPFSAKHRRIRKRELRALITGMLT
jgi:AcrR family transcriptional regulator